MTAETTPLNEASVINILANCRVKMVSDELLKELINVGINQERTNFGVGVVIGVIGVGVAGGVLGYAFGWTRGFEAGQYSRAN